MSDQKKKVSDELKEGMASLGERIKKVEELAKKEAEKKEKSVAASNYIVSGNKSTSDESKALMYFGKSHVKDLLAVNTGEPKYKHVPEHIKGLVRQLKNDVQSAREISQMFYGAPRDSFTGSDKDFIPKVQGVLDHHFGKDVVAARIKAFGSTVVGEGDEWVPTAVASQFIEEFELDRVVEQKFRSVNMPTNPYKLPVQKDVTKARIATEGAAMTSANFKTTDITFDAVKLAEFTILPEELNEDSAPDILALARAEVVEAQARARETAILNGDDDGTHIDSDTQAGAADLAEKAYSGLRKKALANSATVNFSGAAITDAKLRETRKIMGKFGVHPRDLLWIVSPVGYQQMLGTSDVITVEKFGPQATILSGALAAYQGIPIAISEHLREDLNDAGVYDGVTLTKTGLLLVNLRRFMMGNRRPIMTRVMMDLPQQDRWLMASYSRSDFQGHVQSASEISVAYGINILV